MPTTLSDKPFWKRSAFWTTLVSLLTFVGLQFPDWAPGVKVAIQIAQFVATLVVVDQATRSVDMKALQFALQSGAITGVNLTERDGTTPVPTLPTGGV